MALRGGSPTWQSPFGAAAALRGNRPSGQQQPYVAWQSPFGAAAALRGNPKAIRVVFIERMSFHRRRTLGYPDKTIRLVLNEENPTKTGGGRSHHCSAALRGTLRSSYIDAAVFYILKFSERQLRFSARPWNSGCKD
jgi:hypothetical protein